MKTRTKVLTVLIVVWIGVAIGAVPFAVRREMKTYHNQRLTKLIYEYWEIENREIKRVGKETTRLLLPEIICEVPGLFKGRRFYFCLDDFNRTGKYIDLIVKSEERRFSNLFTVGYDVFKPPSDIIRYEWRSFTQDYIGCGYFDSKYDDLESEEEKKIKEKSEEILKIAEEKFESSLSCYQERKNQEQEFIKESQKLGLNLFRVSEILNNQIRAIESSTKTFKGYHSFTIQSEKFERVTCTFFYDPDPDFEIVRLELGEPPEQKCFDVGYEQDYKQNCIWGFINNEGATLGSFELLSDVLRLIEERIKEDPEIIRAALLEKSVK